MLLMLDIERTLNNNNSNNTCQDRIWYVTLWILHLFILIIAHMYFVCNFSWTLMFITKKQYMSFPLKIQNLSFQIKWYKPSNRITIYRVLVLDWNKRSYSRGTRRYILLMPYHLNHHCVAHEHIIMLIQTNKKNSTIVFVLKLPFIWTHTVSFYVFEITAKTTVKSCVLNLN